MHMYLVLGLVIICALHVFDERLKLTGLMTQPATVDLGSLQGQPLWYDILLCSHVSCLLCLNGRCLLLFGTQMIQHALMSSTVYLEMSYLVPQCICTYF